MRRHDLDPIALVFGVIFAVIGVTASALRWNWVDADRGWLLGALLIALGLAGVVTATSRRPRDQVPPG